MTVANEVTAMDFVVNFLDYYETVGIQDKLNQQTQQMETSSGVYALVQEARKLRPERMKDGAAAQKHNETLKRENIIKQVEASPKVINAQERFAKKISENKGARGLVNDFAKALTSGDNVEVGRLGRMIIELNEALETGKVPNVEV